MKNDLKLEDVVASRELPTLPAVASKVLSLTAEEDIDTEAIARTISSDVALASKILKAVNSPLYGFRYPIATIDSAISLMGSNAVRGLVLGFSLVGLRDFGGAHGFDHDCFWEKSFKIAVLSRLIARQGCAVDPEEAFVAGLVANMGEMLAAHLACILGRQNPTPAAAETQDLAIAGIDHCELGAAVATLWNFPPALSLCIRYHEAPQNCEPSESVAGALTRVVHLAELLFAALDDEHVDEERLDATKETLQAFGLKDEFLQQLAGLVHEEVKLATRFFGLRGKPALSPAQMQEEATLRLSRLLLGAEVNGRQLEQTNAQLAKRNEALEKQNDSLEELANLDGLTGVYNHRYFQSFLDKEIKRSERLGQCLSLILADIDDFKPLNDSFGHLAGDDVLKQFCRILRHELREYDLLARYGGEEFVFILPNTPLKKAQVFAERMRLLIEDHPFCYEGYDLKLTISLGVSSIFPGPDCRSPQSSLIGAADRALLQAKAEGKNRVVTDRF